MGAVSLQALRRAAWVAGVLQGGASPIEAEKLPVRRNSPHCRALTGTKTEETMRTASAQALPFSQANGRNASGATTRGDRISGAQDEFSICVGGAGGGVMRAIKFAGAVCVVAVACAAAPSARSQEPFGDAEAITQFQRSVDAYAFQHRQVQRRLGETVAQSAMAAGMRAARPSAAEGDFFTPTIAAAFRHRIAIAFRTRGCVAAPGTLSSEVPRVGTLAISAHAVPSCVSGVLPRLPEELEYRVASVAVILLDTHANIVVDVLHAAFPAAP